MMGRANSEERRNVWTDWLFHLSNLHKLNLKNFNLDDIYEQIIMKIL